MQPLNTKQGRELNPGAKPPAEAQAQGGGDATFAEWLATEMPAGTVIGDPAWWADRIARQYAKRCAPPSAPVGVEAVGSVLQKIRRLALVIRKHETCAPLALDHIGDDLENAASALAQQPAACGTCREIIRPDALTGTTCACDQQPAAKPDAFAVFAGEGGRVFRLSGYDGDTEAQVLGHVLARARREGFAGTAQERMAELGWWIEPMFRRSAQQPAAVDEDYQHGLAFILAHRDAITARCIGPSEQFVVGRTFDALAAQPGGAE